MEELKPCPFCGGEKLTIFAETFWWVYCESCLADGPACNTEEKAIKNWNTRV